MNNRQKFPRIYHLPWSLGKTSDDRVIPKEKLDFFKTTDIIVTEKLDGENTTIYKDYVHARSLDYSSHLSRNIIKRIQGQIGYMIPDGWRICGENVYAKHSIEYFDLKSYFYVFSVYNDLNKCLSWEETNDFVKSIGLEMVPVLYQGKWDEKNIKGCWRNQSVASPKSEQEGYVVRIKDSFCFEKNTDGFSCCFAKYVRANHVKTDQHWIHGHLMLNQLREDD